MAIAAVRPAAPDDVDTIVAIQAGTWSAAYAALVPAEALEQLRSPAARAAWSGAVSDDAGYVLVATEGDWTVGFAAAARASGPVADAADHATADHAATVWGEIGALLVEPRWGRRGHGGRLLAAAAAVLRDAGALDGLAWVPEADEASRRFYARAGWEPDGAVRVLDTGDGELREVRLTGPLDMRLRD